jgi:sugar phosphate isomerase/epimerase
MQIGIFAKTFPADSMEATLDRIADRGIRAVQFNLALTGGPTLPDEIPAPLIARVREALTHRGLEMVAISGTCNLSHPDTEARHDGLHALRTLIGVAPDLGTRVVTVCTGTRDPHDMWRRHPDNDSRDAWTDMVRSVASAVAAAEQNDVTVAFEPELGNVVNGADAGRRLLDEIGSRHLKVVIDAANLPRPGTLDRQAETLERAFDLLGPDLVLAHAKDVREDGTVVPAGRGRLDYALYLSLLRHAGYDGALVLHGLEAAAVDECVAFLRRHMTSPASHAGA